MLRSGFTTGACAAAAGKAAAILLLQKKFVSHITIPFPNGSRFQFKVDSLFFVDQDKTVARASIIKDGGDDPDVTNGALIAATVREIKTSTQGKISISGGVGVGRVTKPGLAIPVGEYAINPVPRKMIQEAIAEVLHSSPTVSNVEVIISVPEGEEISKKTLNERLGIIGGISILGTTGIVRPVSAEAWQATVKTSMKVAKEAGLDTIVVSTGRTSESAVSQVVDFPEEAFVMMGDFLKYSLEQAASFSFKKIVYSGMWGKILKGAMGWDNTHVKNAPLTPENVIDFFQQQGVDKETLAALQGSNSAREIYQRLVAVDRTEIVLKICQLAKTRFEKISGLEVEIYLIGPEKNVIVRC